MVKHEVDVAHARLAVGPGGVDREALEELHSGRGRQEERRRRHARHQGFVVHAADTSAILELVVEVIGIEPGVTVDMVGITAVVTIIIAIVIVAIVVVVVHVFMRAPAPHASAGREQSIGRRRRLHLTWGTLGSG